MHGCRIAPPAQGFDFTGQMRGVCESLVAHLPELAHIDMARVAIGFRQTRKAVSHGLQATLTPMRFAGGSLTTTRRRRKWTIERLHDPSGQEMLYLLCFYVPRFLHLPYREKLITVVHELWHISPEFNGDLRRHPGRCYAHTHSQREYDQAMGALVDKWSVTADRRTAGFLKLNFRQLRRRHGSVFGTVIPTPRLVPLA